MGTTVFDMEKMLAKIFRTAKTWGAVLLLDEADVFLGKRTPDNMEKNAFVSVFLRLLEYYQGILFLTTNRNEDFDPAFLSRIHLTLNYPALDAQKRYRIWNNLLSGDKLQRDESLNEESLKELGRDLDLNGREIKNLLRTAASLAKQARPRRPLTRADIEKVYRLNHQASGIKK